MGNYYTEWRDIRNEASLSWDIAHHLYSRCGHTPAIVMTDKPAAMLASVSKQWHKLLRQVLQERSSTLNADVLLKLSDQIAQMESLRLLCGLPSDTLYGDLFFATPEQLAKKPQAAQTLYLTERLDDAQLSRVTRAMADHGLVVLYSR